MVHHLHRLSGNEQARSESEWLAMLVKTFDTVARESAKPCDRATIMALKTQLARPAAARPANVVALY